MESKLPTLFQTFTLTPAVAPQSRLRAGDDEGAIKAWLAMYAGRANTLGAYRKEAERLWMWLRSNGLTLAGLRHEDMLRYRTFLSDPPAEWIADAPHSRDDDRWRPFRARLKPASVRQAEVVLNGLLSWLVEAKYLDANPLALMRQPRGGRRQQTRFLTRAQWRHVIESIESMPRETGEDRRRYARDRWMLRLAYMTAMRASEIVGHTMDAFSTRDTDAGVRWSLTVTGKGDKERAIPVTGELLDELRDYRIALGLTPLPQPGEAIPLVGAVRGEGNTLTRSGLYRALKAAFERAAASGDEAAAARLRKASTHWLRHTRATHLVGSRVSLNSVRELLGHASLSSTSIYAHEELDRVQSEIEKADSMGAVSVGLAQ